MQEAADSPRHGNLLCGEPTPARPAPNDLLVLIWNDFASKQGWNDSAAELLAKFQAEGGLASRDDLQTLFEYWEVNEGRKLQDDAVRRPGRGTGGVGDPTGARQLCTDLANSGLAGGRMKPHEDDPSRDMNRSYIRWLGFGCVQE